MDFFNSLVTLDQNLLVYLNNKGTSFWDPFWLSITKAKNWIPLFLYWIYLLVKFFDWKKALFLVIFISIMAGLSDTLVNIIKYAVARPRPCWQVGVMERLRILQCSHSFSFVSGHATTSMATTLIVVLLLKKELQWYIKSLFFVWPILFAYSRIYIGKHYPADIITGYLLGIVEAILYLKFAKYLLKKWFQIETDQSINTNATN